MAKKAQKTILVTGATGTQGGAVLRHLRKQGKHLLRVLTRDPEKPEARALFNQGFEVVRGDFDDMNSLVRAVEDVYGVFSVQDLGGGLEGEVRHGVNLVNAANRGGVSHFVYSSVAGADKNTGIPHFESKFRIEEHIRASGIAHTIFRPVSFMENWLRSKDQIKAGTLALPLAPDKHLQMIAADDLGSFVVAAFDHTGHWGGRTVELAGDDLAMSDIAAAFAIAADREVRYQQVPWDQFEQRAGHEQTVMYRWLQDFGFEVDIAALRAELPSLSNLERWINTVWQPAARSEATA